MSALVAALGVTFDQIIDGLAPDGAGPCVRILDVPLDVRPPLRFRVLGGERGV